MADEKLREELLNELKIANGLEVEGLRYDPHIFDEFLKENPDLRQNHHMLDCSIDDTSKFFAPRQIRIGHGFPTRSFSTNFHSPYHLVKESDGFYIEREGLLISKASFSEIPDWYEKTSSSGTKLKDICQAPGSLAHGEGCVFTCYSNECALSMNGKDCRFCNIASTKKRFAEREGNSWKYPKDIAEAVKAAYDEGFDHFNISGGFVPERRELEYYIDVAEAIQHETGLEDFNGTAVIGAPEDLSVLERYKEAGYRTVAIHPEVWGESWFNSICLGKAEVNGGFKHYLEAVDEAVQIFGKGRVRTQFVAGLQPKELVLEGLEYFASRGAVPFTIQWVPAIGSHFAGHRSPTEEWHWDLIIKNYEILKKNGITYEQVYDLIPDWRQFADLYRINNHIDNGTPLFVDKTKK